MNKKTKHRQKFKGKTSFTREKKFSTGYEKESSSGSENG